MNKTAIKNYAIWARQQLIEAAKQRAYEYGVTEKGKYEFDLEIVGGKLLSKEEAKQRNWLISRINSRGYEQVMEEAAYIWFNRFVAVRFMEINGYLPSQIRVFTDSNGAFKPEILKEAMQVELDGLDREKVLELMDKHNDEALYKYLFITQCNALSTALPGMFETIADWTELLFPANLLRADSVIGRMISDIPEEDWTDQVQIIGWLYQYYNTELKDDTFALLKKNVKVTKERVPAATQLFTPDWIVRYMVENSLGRLWLEGHPDDALKAKWKYYLEEAEQEPETAAELAKIRAEQAKLQPEQIKVIDPCMGSGHILVYAFDVLMQIYLSQGWSERDAAQSIVEHNLHGLDIDERATQLAYFAVMMKARKHDRRFLTRGVQPEVYCTKGDEDGTEYGSLQIVKEVGPRPEQQDLFGNNEDSWNYRRLLAGKYDVVVTNPPYMGGSGMDARLGEFVKKNYPDSKTDLFACFIERCSQLAGKNGYQAMITQHAWMFLSSFEKLRTKLQTVDTVNMVHLGARAFEEIGGEVVQTTSFVMRKSNVKGYQGTYCRLIEPTTQQGKEDMFLAGENRYVAQQENFSKITGMPVAYWVSEGMYKIFEIPQKICDFADLTGSQHITANNEKYLRYHWEVEQSDRWIQYAKGGEFRKWYGNIIYVVDWSKNALEFYKSNSTSNMLNSRYVMQPGIAYTDISSLGTGFRWFKGGAFDKSGPVLCYVSHSEYILALLNCSIFAIYATLVNPTMHLQVRDIKQFPVYIQKEEKVNLISQQNKALSQTDWDFYEISLDFKRHPMV